MDNFNTQSVVDGAKALEGLLPDDAVIDDDDAARIASARGQEPAPDDLSTEGQGTDGDTDTEGDGGTEDGSEVDAPKKADDDAGQDAGDDTPEVSSIEDLADYLEIKPDDLLAKWTIDVKADGETKTATLADVIAGYQKGTNYDRDKTELAQERRSFESERANAIENINQLMGVATQQWRAQEQALEAQLQSPEIRALEQSDPSAWTAKTLKLQQQLDGLRTAHYTAVEQFNQYNQALYDEHVKHEFDILQRDVPDWSKEKLTEALDTIKSFGYSEEQAATLADSGLIKGALELSGLRKEVAELRAKAKLGEKAASEVKTKVPKKVLKGGKGKPAIKAGAKNANLAEKLAKLGKTGDVRDAAAVIEDLGYAEMPEDEGR